MQLRREDRRKAVSEILPRRPLRIVAFNEGDYKKALAKLSQAISLDATYALAYHQRGETYHKINKYTEAVADYDRAIALDPEANNSFHSRGLAYLKTNDFNKAIEIDPSNADAYHNRGIVYEVQKQENLANKDFAKAKELESKDN